MIRPRRLMMRMEVRTVTETVNGIAFVILAATTLVGAVGVLWSRNVIHAAFWLLEVSLSAVGLYFLLEADYVALVQLLVYAGAVAVLLVFTVMITLRRREDAERARDLSWPSAVLGLVFFGTVVFAVFSWSPAVVPMPEAAPGIVDLGRRLFSIDGSVLPFEIASLVLTAALVAAVWWAREGDE